MIISVSRRCDIPRFQFSRFLEQLDAGFAETANPFNAAQVKRVSLQPADVDCFVFWTRDPRAILENAKRLNEFPFYVMTTLTGYPAIIEANMPSPQDIIQAMRDLSAQYGPQRVIWRYDPILLTSLTDAEFHRRNFADLAARLAGAVNRVIVSVYDAYAASERRLAAMAKNGLCRTFPHYTEGGHFTPELRELLTEMARIAAQAEMDIRSCAEGENLRELGIRPGACIDGELIREIAGGVLRRDIAGRDKNQRPHCRCVSSTDIGSYGPCPAGCVYCYARR